MDSPGAPLRGYFFGPFMIDPNLLTDTAEVAARRAGEMLREKWSQPRKLESKGFRNIVTDSDYTSQALIAETILARFPDHGFLAEEEDSKLPEDGPVIWVVDPIDGTTNFSREIPTFCISIGATIAGESVGGVIYDPMRDELFRAAKGNGATLNSKPIKASGLRDLNRMILAVDYARTVDDRQRLFDSIQAFGHELRSLRAVGAAAIALAWIAAGRIDFYLNYTLSAWDVAAADIMIREAGGRVTCADGSKWTLANSHLGIFASNGLLHEEARLRLCK